MTEKNYSGMTIADIEKEYQIEQVRSLARQNKGDMTVRFGAAPEVHDPTPVVIIGTIDAPLRWLEKRASIIDLTQCNIIVNREAMHIHLTINERDHFSDAVTGRLITSDEFRRFGINEGHYLTGIELSDLIRMNRSCFESKQKAMELVTIMRNFKATVTTYIENSDDKKGNTAQVRRQAVEGNQPPSFELCIPIFKGQPKVTFTVEIDIDPDTLQATLVSPDAQDIIAETRDNLMDQTLGQIQQLCPEIPIIEL